jgi:hypothetical protein
MMSLPSVVSMPISPAYCARIGQLIGNTHDLSLPRYSSPLHYSDEFVDKLTTYFGTYQMSLKYGTQCLRLSWYVESVYRRLSWYAEKARLVARLVWIRCSVRLACGCALVEPDQMPFPRMFGTMGRGTQHIVT